MDLSQHCNRLAQETSPYLLQHAHNPVDWYPWGPEALTRAREENKPILLSIGYSACHWCHVMAHESFEDEDAAAVMNELFINIKVDREERPDLDKIYQLAHHVLLQRGGGWPLTMFLAPDSHIPYFGGTYFPKTPRHGLPAFVAALKQVAAYYERHRDDIDQQNDRLLAVFQRLDETRPNENATLDAAPLDGARSQLAQQFDAAHGGFGGAPKFPHPTHLERLLRHYAGTALAGQPDHAALDMARLTLTKMGDGGINDQLGGGFFRYAVDEQWMIPHFEKMLYDNGPLLAIYAQAWRLTDDGLYRRVVEETAAWVQRDLQAPEGGYYTALDADSEGEEGKYYAWTPDQARAVLDDEEYALLARRYGLDSTPNFEPEVGASQHRWHLHVFRGLRGLSQDFSRDIAELLPRIDGARAKLYAARLQRPAPGRDEKILPAWNGLMIKGMAVAGRYLDDATYLMSATRALDFVRDRLWHNGRLQAVYKDGRTHYAAYLDDYVFLIDAILELLQARWRSEDMLFAIALADAVLAHFEDREQGGFFFTADDHERLIHRPKPLADESLPAGNGVAATVLGRLGHILGETRYLDAAERTVRTAWHSITELPYAHDALLVALEEILYPPQVIIMRGESSELAPWQARCAAHYAPRRWSCAIPNDANDLPAALAERPPLASATAYVCNAGTCSAPIIDHDEFAVVLQATEVTL